MEPQEVISEDILLSIIDKRKPLGLFYTVKSDNHFIAVDNSTGEAWTEDFSNFKDCIDYLKRN